MVCTCMFIHITRGALKGVAPQANASTLVLSWVGGRENGWQGYKTARAPVCRFGRMMGLDITYWPVKSIGIR